MNNLFIFKINFLKVMFLFVTSLLLFSCESNINEVRKINIKEFKPVGEANDINLKYTDSGRIKAILLSPKMLDFSNLEYGFTEFPKGVNITVYDDLANKNYVTSKYAISYIGSNIIDLVGKVKITTHDGRVLETEQLYYDQKNNWFYTEKAYKYTNHESVIDGEGIDFSKDFKTLDTQQITGIYNL
jgi:LPS export ABC transporter protein LptC